MQKFQRKKGVRKTKEKSLAKGILKYSKQQIALHKLNVSDPNDWMPRSFGSPRDWSKLYLMLGMALMPEVLIIGVWFGIAFTTQLIISFRKKMRMERYHERMHEMRKIRKPHSDNPPPSPEELAAQWNKVHDSLQEMLKFGNMLIDLEASDLIDNSPILNYDTSDGVPVIVARKPGLKGWLAEHCPHIGYSTAMRYKSIAQKAQNVPTKTEQFIKQSSTICDLYENLFKELKLEHYELEEPRKPRAKLRTNGLERFRQPGAGDRKLQPLIFSFRTNTRTALKKLSPEQQQQFIDSLLSLAKECGETLRKSTKVS